MTGVAVPARAATASRLSPASGSSAKLASTNAELIARIEATSGRDSELDCLIAVAASKEPTSRVAYMAGRRWYKKPGAGRIPFAGAFGTGAALGMIFQAHRYTASLDAAMMLVPDGRDWMVDNFDGPVGRRCSASVFNDPSDEFADYEAFAATPALALCAAALKARAAQPKEINP